MLSIRILCCCLLSASLWAQPAQEPVIFKRGSGVWNGTYLKVRLSKHFGYYGEHHLRLRNRANDANSFVGNAGKNYNRFGLHFFPSDKVELVGGPALILNFSPRPSDDSLLSVMPEIRLWWQLLLKGPPIGRVKIYHQFRFENRWRRSNQIGDTYQYTTRYRYKISAYLPINNKKIEPGTFYFSPSVEIFFQSGKSIVYNPLEDLRIYNGFGYVLNQNFSFFAGYMWTLGQRPSGFEYGRTDIIRLNLLMGFDTRKTESLIPQINFGY